MIDITDRERQIIAWTFLVGVAIFSFRCLALELIEAIAAYLLKIIRPESETKKSAPGRYLASAQC